MNNRTDFVAGFLLGGLLGAALALLFAPKSGEEIRHTLASSAEQWRDRADEVLSKVKTTAEEVSQRGRARVDEGAQRLREIVERGRETVQERTREPHRQGDGESTA